MSVRLLRFAFRSIGVGAVVAALALTGSAQTQGRGAAFSPARLSDGKTPDFRGIWQVRDTAYVNIEGHPAEKGIAAAKSIIVDPPNGRIPYNPQALAQRQENYRNRATADPSIKCYQAGVPRATYLPTPLQILQSPGNFAVVYQDKAIHLKGFGVREVGRASAS